MKKKSPVFLFTLLCLLLIIFPAGIHEAKTALKLNKNKIVLSVGQTAKVKAEGGQELQWSSSNSKIVKITKTSAGKNTVTIKAVKKGTAKIVCRSGSSSKTCRVVVEGAKASVPDKKPDRPAVPIKDDDPEPGDHYIPKDEVPDADNQDDECTITLNANGGTVTPGSLKKKRDTQIGELPTPVRKQYTFLGWWADVQTGGSLMISPEYIVKDDMTCIAHWEKAAVVTASALKVEYKGGNVAVGGHVNRSDLVVTVIYSDGKEEVTDQYEIADYEIKEGENILTIICMGQSQTIKVTGVKDEDKPDKPDGPDEPGKPDEPDKPAPPSTTNVTVSFRPEGGSAVADMSVAAGATLPYVPTSTRTGYTFRGWYTGVNGSGSMLTTSTRIEKSTIYYAHWAAAGKTIIALRAYYTGTAYAGDNTYTGLTVSVLYSDGTTENVMGYTTSQSVLQEGSNTFTVTYAGHVQTVTVTAHARARIVREITAEFKGGEAPVGTFTSYGNLIVTAYYSDGTSEIVSGYTLSTQTIQPGSNVITVFYEGRRATFSVIGYQRTSVAVGNVPNMTNVWVTEGGKLLEALGGYVPVRAGYVFDGWYLDERCTQRVSPDTVTQPNTSVYAKWSKLYSWELNKKKVTIKKGKTTRLFIDGLENSRITWSTSKKKVASVTKNGKVKAKKKGTAYITAVTYDGTVLRCKVRVKK